MRLENIPHEPGCYLFKDRAGAIIYIGKAKDLQKRVSSYFQKKDLDPKTSAMVEKAVSVDFIVTRNEKEAFILESNFIKKNQPKYNINLRDSKRYAYIMLTNEDYPRLLVARKRILEGAYFGPFISGEQRDELLRFAQNVFKLRTCKKLPKKVCLRFHMDLCTAPCEKKVSLEGYQSQVEDVKAFLSGKNKNLIQNLKSRMAESSKKQDYEQAAILRNRITALSSLLERQSMETEKKHDQDIINYIKDGDVVHLAVFNAYHGILSNKDNYDFDYSEDFLEEFLAQYYSEEPVPKELILPMGISPALLSYLSEKRGSRIIITVPYKGEKKDLLELVKKNLEKSFKEGDIAMHDLKEKIGLDKDPKTIECFDISHLSGTSSVGSMVSFKEGKPEKSNYRRFKIKTIEGVDDFAMMGEVVRRRYLRLLEEKRDMPDLIVVDGGLGQLSSALNELKLLGVKIPIVALAKRMEEVYFPGHRTPRSFDLKSPGMKLLQNIRDEAHRFAVSYHKVLRSKRMLNKK